MSIRKDKIIVVDIEATCWEGFTAPPGQENEIIEIGVCLLDPTKNAVTAKRSILVRPEYSVISPFCTELTSITQAMVDKNGLGFADACAILEKEYDSRNRLWASWGSLDRELFLKQTKKRKVRYPFSGKHANLKRVFGEVIGERMSLVDAMGNVGVERAGVAHRGDDDAYNTAMLLNQLMQTHGQQILHRYGW